MRQHGREKIGPLSEFLWVSSCQGTTQTKFFVVKTCEDANVVVRELMNDTSVLFEQQLFEKSVFSAEPITADPSRRLRLSNQHYSISNAIHNTPKQVNYCTVIPSLV
jgi:hypothetical protein